MSIIILDKEAKMSLPNNISLDKTEVALLDRSTNRLYGFFDIDKKYNKKKGKPSYRRSLNTFELAPFFPLKNLPLLLKQDREKLLRRLFERRNKKRIGLLTIVLRNNRFWIKVFSDSNGSLFLQDFSEMTVENVEELSTELFTIYDGFIAGTGVGIKELFEWGGLIFRSFFPKTIQSFFLSGISDLIILTDSFSEFIPFEYFYLGQSIEFKPSSSWINFFLSRFSITRFFENICVPHYRNTLNTITFFVEKKDKEFNNEIDAIINILPANFKYHVVSDAEYSKIKFYFENSFIVHFAGHSNEYGDKWDIGKGFSLKRLQTLASRPILVFLDTCYKGSHTHGSYNSGMLRLASLGIRNIVYNYSKIPIEREPSPVVDFYKLIFSGLRFSDAIFILRLKGIIRGLPSYLSFRFYGTVEDDAILKTSKRT